MEAVAFGGIVKVFSVVRRKYLTCTIAHYPCNGAASKILERLS
jgi:hypothetical protein